MTAITAEDVAELLGRAPTETTVDLIAELIRRDSAALGSPDSSARAHNLAKSILALIVGADGEPGPLDRYLVASTETMVVWYCPRDHDHGDGDSGAHAGVIARNLEGDQSGLTLGEMLQHVLEHEDEAHSGAER